MMEYRVSDQHLDHLKEENGRCEEIIFSEKRDLIADLKDARVEIDRLNHKIELLQGPGEA